MKIDNGEYQKQKKVFARLKTTEAFQNWRLEQFFCQDFQCAWCRRAIPNNGTIPTDHIFSLNNGGISNADNLCLTCIHCNSAKSSSHRFSPKKRFKQNKFDGQLTAEFMRIAHSLDARTYELSKPQKAFRIPANFILRSKSIRFALLVIFAMLAVVWVLYTGMLKLPN